MKTSRAFMTAVPLALILIATLAVLVAATPGAFSFDRWPDAPEGAFSEREVVVDVPVAERPTARADARRAPAVERDGANLVARAPQQEPLRADELAAPVVPPVAASGPEHAAQAQGDGVTAAPVAVVAGPVVAGPQEASPAPLRLQDRLPLPDLPAKELPDEPGEPAPEWPGDRAAMPRRPHGDDQE